MNTLLENIRASAILMKNLPSTLSGDALLISREEARRIGYELEACAERMEQASAASPKVPQDDHIMDALVYGTGFMQDGKRVDPKEVYKQALPQGVEEWIARHQQAANSTDTAPAIVLTDDLRAYLSGMAIVPVEQIEKILPRIDAELQVVDAIIQCTQAMLPQETLDEIETSLALLQDIKAMLAAAKEKQL